MKSSDRSQSAAFRIGAMLTRLWRRPVAAPAGASLMGKGPWGGGDDDGEPAQAPRHDIPDHIRRRPPGEAGAGSDPATGPRAADGDDRTPRRNPWLTPEGGAPAGGDAGGGGGPLRGNAAIEELLRRGRGGGGGGPVRRFGGGGGLPGSGRLWGYGLLALVALWLLSSIFHIVPPEREGVVTRLGSYHRTVDPGIRLTLPAPFERMETLDVKAIRTMPVGSPSANANNFVLTRDQNVIDLAYEVRWSIRDPERYMFQLAEPEETIKDVAQSAMRAAVANFDLNAAIGPGRSDIEADVGQRMQALLDSYRSGVAIQGIAIRQADPPEQVNEAFKEVTVAQQQRESNINLARAYQQQVLERARGDTAAFDKIYEEYRLAPDVTRRRLYYETMEGVLSQVDKTIIEADGVTPYLPLPEMRRRAEAAPATPAQPTPSAQPAPGGTR